MTYLPGIRSNRPAAPAPEPAPVAPEPEPIDYLTALAIFTRTVRDFATAHACATFLSNYPRKASQ